MLLDRGQGSKAEGQEIFVSPSALCLSPILYSYAYSLDLPVPDEIIEHDTGHKNSGKNAVDEPYRRRHRESLDGAGPELEQKERSDQRRDVCVQDGDEALP